MTIAPRWLNYDTFTERMLILNRKAALEQASKSGCEKRINSRNVWYYCHR